MLLKWLSAETGGGDATCTMVEAFLNICPPYRVEPIFQEKSHGFFDPAQAPAIYLE
jgi:hypothetical protein